MPRLSEMSGLTVAAMILSGVGLVLLAGGAITLVGFTHTLDADRARVEALTPLDATALRQFEAGRDVLLEGRISASQAPIFRDFVAYERQEREQVVDALAKEWSWRDRKTPALMIDLPGGTVRIRESYFVQAPAQEWLDPRVVNRRETRYVGLVPGEAVLVLGRAAGGDVDAHLVAPGSRATYLRRVASGRTVARWLGGGLTAVGSLLLLVATGLVVHGRRQPSRSGA
jgi:hypothetical protein